MKEKEILLKKIQNLLDIVENLHGIDKKQFRILARTELKEIQKVKEKKEKDNIEINKITSELRNNLDSLRLSIKYILFDLEATRRENSYLRRMLEDSN